MAVNPSSSASSGFAQNSEPDADGSASVSQAQPLCDLKFERIEACELGCTLPVGLFTPDGEHLKDFELDVYRTKYDRILGTLLQAPKAKITSVLGQFLPQYIKTIGGYTFPELSQKFSGISAAKIIENMALGDALAIVVQIRLASQGVDIAMSAQCTNCGAQNDDDPMKGRPYHDLSSTEVVCFTELSQKPLIDVVLKDGIERMGETIKHIYMQPLRLFQLEKIATPGSGTPVDIALLYGMISAIPDVEAYQNVRGQVFSDELYDDLSQADLEILREAVEKIQPGPDMNAEMTCASCGTDFKSQIPWVNLRSFLFTSAKAGTPG